MRGLKPRWLGLAGPLGVATGVLLAFSVAGCGSTTKTTRSSSSGGAVQVSVTAPSDGSTVNADHVNVRGTVSPPNATVEVLGQSAQVGNGIFTASVALNEGKNSIDVVASASGAAPASTTVTVNRPSHGSGHGGGGSGGSSVAHEQPPGGRGTTSCGGGLSVGPNTTCAFAQDVQNAYNANGPGTMDVFSPVTGQTYSMTCSAGSPHVCTGGNNASVYFP